jgi:hypothetical protein
LFYNNKRILNHLLVIRTTYFIVFRHGFYQFWASLVCGKAHGSALWVESPVCKHKPRCFITKFLVNRLFTGPSVFLVDRIDRLADHNCRFGLVWIDKKKKTIYIYIYIYILGVIMKSHVMDMKFHPLNFMLKKFVNK